MSFSTRRRRVTFVSLVVATGLTAISNTPGSAQPNWPFELEWEQPGQTPAYYELCVDGECQWLAARAIDGGRWCASLPLLVPGEHRLVVQACGLSACVRGTPEIFVRVVRPNPRTPPVISSSAQ